MTIKSKLYVGLGFLFAVLTSLGGLGIFYLYRLSYASKEILKDNYETLLYAKNMTRALDEMAVDQTTSLTLFEENLALQEKNISEIGEHEVTKDIRREYAFFKRNGQKQGQERLIRQKLQQLTDINMQAILRKSTAADKSANTAIAYMSVMGSIAFLVCLSFIVTFPNIIANPIAELAQSIREIANKNYQQRLHFHADDEFGEVARAFNAMAERLDEYESSNLAQIIFQKKRVETVINTMHDPIIGLDEHNRVLFANKDATAILGIPEKHLLGKSAPEIALHNDLLRVLLREERTTKPLKIFFDEKESFFVKESFEIKAEEKNIGKAIVLKNVTEFKELDSAKTNFIATISHELKTPIASIKMSLKLLEDQRVGQLNEEQEKLVAGIKEDSQRLLKITGELLDLTQVESGKIQLERQATQPQELVHVAYETVRFQAEQKQVNIQFDFEEGIPMLSLDKEKTTWVLINLLSNAIRYSNEQGRIVMGVRKQEKKIVLSVQDFGKGIDPKYKERIFEKYFKVPDGNGHGTGLGLAISKEFVEAQGGKIYVESTLGIGTVFCIEFDVSGMES